jgi:plastocyanin
MRLEKLAVLFASVAVAASAAGQNVTGTIIIKKRLTRRNVTADVSVYQRGAAVRLGKDSDVDPIAYERSRVVVYLEGSGLASVNSAPAATAQIEQLDRRFQPDLAAVPVGSTVSFPNMDPIFHNIFSLSKARTFDLGSYDKGETRTVLFTKPGIVEVYCHLHPNMAATVVVTPNRYFTRPDPSGLYRIENVPPGQYTLVAWHKSAGFFRKPILIEAGRDSAADFLIPIEDDAR